MARTAAKPPTAPAKPPRHACRAITPDYVEALRQYSDLLYRGGFHGGKECKRYEAVAAKIEVGRDLGIPATQAIAWIMIVNGKPTIYGDLGMAMIRSSGLLDESHLKEWYEGEGDDFTACFTIKRVGPAEPRTVRFSVGDAKRAKLWGKAGPWTEYPERQLMWRAKGFACRDEFQDVLCGLTFVEEAADAPGADWAEVARVAEQVGIPTPPAGRPDATATDGPTTPTTFPLDGPITDDQLEELARLRDLAFAAKGLTDEVEQDEAWAAVLADYGTLKSARELTAFQANELCESLGAKYDPFTYGPTRQPPPTAGGPDVPATAAA